MSALNDLREMLDTHTQMYRDAPEVTQEQRGSVGVMTINGYPHRDQAPHPEEVVDLLLTFVGPKPDSPPADRERFVRVLGAALRNESGEFASMSLEDFRGGPSYITLGAWLGSQDLALRLIGLGKILGLWEVMSGGSLGMSREEAVELAGGGLLMPLPTPETVADLFKAPA